MKDFQKKREALVKGIESLPTLPIISQKIMEIVRDRNASFKELVKLIETDQALAVQIGESLLDILYPHRAQTPAPQPGYHGHGDAGRYQKPGSKWPQNDTYDK